MSRPITDELVQEVTRKIVERFHPKRIVVFGGYARGDHGPDSDLDLLVEMDSAKTFWSRIPEIDSLFQPRDWPMDLFVFTPEEVAQDRDINGTLVNLAEREGKVVYVG